MSIIKDRLRQQAAEFISLRETLGLMAKAGEGCTIKEAATFLYRGISKRKSLHWQTILYGDIAEADNGYAAPLLDTIVKNGGLVFSFDDFYSLPDCDQYGFLRAELIEFLSAEGVHLSEKSDPVPEWAKSCKGIKRFTLAQAAGVLIGLDPMDDRWPGDEGQRELDKASTALTQAFEDGDLQPFGKDGGDRPLFRAQDLRAWAASVGLDWCIPFDAPAVAVTPAGAADEATRHRLRQLEAENAQLVEQVAELQRQLQEATAAPQQAPQEAGPAPQQAPAAPQNDDAKPWSKAERKTFVNIVGAMLDLLVPHVRTSETLLIETLEDVYGNRGLKARTLQKKFAEAKRSIKPD